MLDTCVVVFRFVQYGGAAILFGLPLFLLYTLPPAAEPARWMKSLPVMAAAAVLIGTAFGIVAQTDVLAGSLAEAIKPATILTVLTEMNFGRSGAVRIFVVAATLVSLLGMRPGRPLWRAGALGGGVACASMAWMGHGGATEGAPGTIHLIADVFHLMAAAGWIGALAGFSMLLLERSGTRDQQELLDQALRKFSGIGASLVAVVLATGLINSYFLVGFRNISGLWTTSYGQLLLLKLALFAVMLGLAAGNRMLLAPALTQALDAGRPTARVLAGLRRSIVSETIAAAAVLALVAWLGTLAPVAAG